ncbi:hypothetical protein GJ496_007470 [Pomphorhynchus laevis]|nr:hypothetical protein GJ496_007470 [Pomphorhynchus laevis]
MNENNDGTPNKSSAEELVEKLIAQNEEYLKEVISLKQQQESMNAAMNITLLTKDEQISQLNRKYEEEIASYQRLMKEAVNAAVEQCNHEWSTRCTLLEDENNYLHAQTSDLKIKLKNAETRLKASKQDDDCSTFKALIDPMEEEINSLKEQLQSSERRLAALNFRASFKEEADDDTGFHQSSDNSKSLGEAVSMCEQLECLKIQVNLEHDLREKVENKLSELALDSLTKSTEKQCLLDNLDIHLQNLDFQFNQLCSFQRHSSRFDQSTSESSVIYKSELYPEVQSEYSEEFLLIKTLESDYQRVLEHNLELETECKDLRKQLEISQQATSKAISTIRAEVDKRCQTIDR